MISVGTRFMKNGKLWRIAEIRRPLGTYRIFLSENQSGEKAVMSRQDIGEWWDELDEGELWNLTLPESSSETAVRMVTRPRSTTGNVNNTESALSESADELSDNEAIDIAISKPRVSSIDNPIPSTSYDTIPGPSTKSTPARFVKVTSSDVDQAIKSTENKSTMRKTAGHIKLLRQFMIENGDNREILSLSIEELDDTLSRYFLSVRKPDGTDYEPVTLRNQLGSFDRYLRQHDYGGQGVTLIGKDSQFKKTKSSLKSKQKSLKSEGRGNQPMKSDIPTSEELDTFYRLKQLGPHNPTSVLNTLWFNNTVHFGMRGGVTEHRSLCWGDITLKTENNLEYLQLNELQTKTRDGANPRDVRRVRPKMWASTKDPERCPVAVYKLFREKRPSGSCVPDAPFYLGVVTHDKNPKPDERYIFFFFFEKSWAVWFIVLATVIWYDTTV